MLFLIFLLYPKFTTLVPTPKCIFLMTLIRSCLSSHSGSQQLFFTKLSHIQCEVLFVLKVASRASEEASVAPLLPCRAVSGAELSGAQRDAATCCSLRELQPGEHRPAEQPCCRPAALTGEQWLWIRYLNTQDIECFSISSTLAL